MSSSDQLDAALRQLGYYLRRARGDTDAPRRRWRVLCVQCHAGWDCDNLEEVRSLVRALREWDARGRRGLDIIWDGAEWICVEVE